MFYDSTILIVIPFFLLALYAQSKVKSTYTHYSKLPNKRGLTGADVAMQLLKMSGIYDVRVERTSGQLTDHYDPAKRVLRLSDAVYGSSSLAAIGVAAHEAGHAVQHQTGYAPLAIRSAIVPAVSIGSNLAMPLIVFGLLFSMRVGGIGSLLLSVGIILYSGVVLFQLITLPVEFNASGRAIEMLEQNNFLTHEEIIPVKKVLNAAALTYVAAAAAAAANLLRFLLLANSRRR